MTIPDGFRLVRIPFRADDLTSRRVRTRIPEPRRPPPDVRLLVFDAAETLPADSFFSQSGVARRCYGSWPMGRVLVQRPSRYDRPISRSFSCAAPYASARGRYVLATFARNV